MISKVPMWDFSTGFGALGLLVPLIKAFRAGRSLKSSPNYGRLWLFIVRRRESTIVVHCQKKGIGLLEVGFSLKSGDGPMAGMTSSS